MKKMWLFVFGFVVVLVLAGCSSPTPMASNAMPLEALIATTEPTPEIIVPETVVPEIQEINTDELFALYGDHFPAESLGYSKEDKGVLLLINGQKYLVKDEYLEFQLYDDNQDTEYIFLPNLTNETSQSFPVSVSSQGMFLIGETNDQSGLSHRGCFIFNMPQQNQGFSAYGYISDQFVSFDQMIGKEGDYFFSLPCYTGVLVNDYTSKTSAFIPGDIEEVRNMDKFGSIDSSKDFDNRDQSMYHASGFPYLGQDREWGGNYLLVSDFQLDMEKLSALATTLTDNWDRLPKLSTEHNAPDFYTIESPDVTCNYLRAFWKMLPMQASEVEKACGGELTFEDKVGIGLYTISDYTIPHLASVGWGSAFNQWYFGVGDIVLDGYITKNLKMGTTEIDPFTSITRTGQSCQTPSNEDGEMIIIVSTLHPSPVTSIQCIGSGKYLYFIPSSDPYILYDDKYDNPRALVFKITE